jgi:hypothetical protein
MIRTREAFPVGPLGDPWQRQANSGDMMIDCKPNIIETLPDEFGQLFDQPRFLTAYQPRTDPAELLGKPLHRVQRHFADREICTADISV